MKVTEPFFAASELKPVYNKLLLPDQHFALFGCKIAQGLAEGHRDVSPDAAAFAAAALRYALACSAQKKGSKFETILDLVDGAVLNYP